MPTYISAAGLKKMEEELEHRRMVIRREIADKIGAATELGDLSENFEYHEAKEQQGSNEVRISQLESMIKDCVIVTSQTGGGDITLGSTFVAEVGGAKKTFKIVGSNESNPIEGKISNESPIGQAFMGHGIGDEVAINVPSGTMVYKILEIT